MKHALALLLLSCAACQSTQEQDTTSSGEPQATGSPFVSLTSRMELGTFSVSLAVEDIAASRAFYEKLGFDVMGGVQEQNWLILKNGTTTIGLFQGMFPDNIMTFNPGWHVSGDHPDEFIDIRELQARLLEQGITPVTPITAEAAATTGPASCVILDPDGNAILLDQHR